MPCLDNKLDAHPKTLMPIPSDSPNTQNLFYFLEEATFAFLGVHTPHSHFP